MEPIEIGEIPSGISDYLAHLSRTFPRKPNHYWVTDICKCIRQSYYEIIGTPPDDNVKPSIETLWALKSRMLLHNLTYAYKWRELDFAGEVSLDDSIDMVTMHGRLDMYDHKSETIIDLKTSNAIKWQQQQGIIPRQFDVDQIQCYGTLFREVIRVSKLTLLYVDMKNLISFNIPSIDRTNWIRARLGRLHHAFNRSDYPPPAERSKSCDHCPFKERCEQQDRTGR